MLYEEAEADLVQVRTDRARGCLDVVSPHGMCDEACMLAQMMHTGAPGGPRCCVRRQRRTWLG